MSVSALLRLAPLLDLANLDEQRRRGCRDVYDTGSLQLINAVTPLVVDHQMDHPVGVVREISYWPDERGRFAWATVTITSPPGWLKRGGPVSLGFIPLLTSDLGGGMRRVVRAGVKEITLVSPTHEALEPLARVATISPAAGHSEPAAGRVIPGGRQLLIRRNTGRVLAVR